MTASAPPQTASHPGWRALPRRDRIAVLAALLGMSALAWVYLIAMARGMSGMAGMRSWTAAEFLGMFAMWAIMMVGMMVPSAVPTTLVYAAVARKAARQGTPVAPTALFVLGYVGLWTAFSVGATLAQWVLERGALLSPMMVSQSPLLGASLLVLAGLYQLTPLKEACLRHCRAPARFIADHWRPGRAGAFRLGCLQGAYCLGCCWILMGLLFLGGVMNLLWIATITAFVLVEKMLPAGRAAGRLGGVGMLVAGVLVLVGRL